MRTMFRVGFYVFDGAVIATYICMDENRDECRHLIGISHSRRNDFVNKNKNEIVVSRETPSSIDVFQRVTRSELCSLCIVT